MEAGSGERLGRYVLTRRLGAGGMAEVFEAVDELLRRRVAVKVVRGPLAESGEFTTRFLREARLAAQLRHPNVVPIYDVGVDRGVLFVVMPVLEGGTLSERAQAGLDDATSLGWLAALASALDYAHGHGVVHRDVKPQNVLFDDAGALQLSDFGLARSLEETTQLTQTGAVLGTPVYMSPEQVSGSVVGPATDQYALGVLTFRLLTGRLPIEQASAPVVLQKTLFERLPPPSAFRPGLPPAVDAAVARALAKRPGERFPSCSAFVEALARALSLSTGASPGDVPTTLLSHAGRPTLPPTVVATPPPRSSAVSRGATPRPPPARVPPAPEGAERRSPLPLPGASRTLWSDPSSTRAAPPSVPLPVVLIGLGLAVALALSVGISLARRGGSRASRPAQPVPSPPAPTAAPALVAALPPPAATTASPAPEPTPPPLEDVTVVEVYPSPTAIAWAIPSMARRPAAPAPLPPAHPPVLTATLSPATSPPPSPTHGAYLFPTPVGGAASWPTATPTTPAPPPAPTRPPAPPSATPVPTTPPDPLASVPVRKRGPRFALEKAVVRVERSAYVIALDFSDDLDSPETVGTFATLRVTTRGNEPLLLHPQPLTILPCKGLSGDEVLCEVDKALTRFGAEDEELTEDDTVEVRAVVGGFLLSERLPVED